MKLDDKVLQGYGLLRGLQQAIRDALGFADQAEWVDGWNSHGLPDAIKKEALAKANAAVREIMCGCVEAHIMSLVYHARSEGFELSAADLSALRETVKQEWLADKERRERDRDKRLRAVESKVEGTATH